MIFEDVIGAYFSVRKRLRGEAVRDTYSLKRLLPFFAGRDMYNLKRVDVRGYVAARQDAGVKLSTVRRELRLLSAAINFVKFEHELDTLPNPVARLGLEVSEPRVRWITRDEAARLLCAAERASRPHFPVFVRLALNTGCRKSELMLLEWSRVDFERQQILLEARHTKARRRRTVYLNDDAMKALERLRIWQSGNNVDTPWVFGGECGRIASFKTAWATALARSGIQDFRIHDMRHTFASWLVMQGESIYVVKELLGHASITQTEIYAHLAPSQAKDAVQRLLPI